MDHLEQMTEEYNAWCEVVRELRERDVADIEDGGKDYGLYTAIVLWAEELAELRHLDPDRMHAVRALAARRNEREKLLNEEA